MNEGESRVPTASRRTFVKGLTALAAGVGVVRLAEAAAAEAARLGGESPRTPRYGLLVDVNRCKSGCTACVDACQSEHGWYGFDSPLTDAQWIRKVELRNRRTGREVAMPVMCQHCEHPPCVDVCPTGASFKRADGIVLVDKHTCIGCRYCMMACPYKARSFIHENLTEQLPEAPRGKGTVESCTLCVHRVDEGEGRQPACVDACTQAGHQALQFGDLHDPDSAIATRLRTEQSRELRNDLDLATGVRYHGL